MVEPYVAAPDLAGSARWPLATLGLVAAGWVVFLLAQGYADRLRERWGPAPDVVDALGRDAFVGERTLAYFTAAVVLDAAAAVSLLARSRRWWPLAVKVVAGILLVPSAGLHGLVWLVVGLFAA